MSERGFWCIDAGIFFSSSVVYSVGGEPVSMPKSNVSVEWSNERRVFHVKEVLASAVKLVVVKVVQTPIVAKRWGVTLLNLAQESVSSD